MAGPFTQNRTGAEDRAESGDYEWLRFDKSYDFLRRPKRDVSCRFESYALCPDSVGGGCCPLGYECDETSCYAGAPVSSPGCPRDGFHQCGLEEGAGTCCPNGLICNKDGGCDIPAGSSYTVTCPANYFACPVALAAGCCPNGLECGKGVCFETTPTTQAISYISTITNSNGDRTTTVVTTDTVITPGPTESYNTNLVTVLQLAPSTLQKFPAVTGSSDEGDSTGLSKPALGGIVAGVIALLVAIIVAAFIILRRLRRTEQAAKAAEAAAESRKETSTSPPRLHKPGFGQPTVSEFDGADLDPLAHVRSHSDSSSKGIRSRSETPNNFCSNVNNSSRTTSPPAWHGQHWPDPEVMLQSDASHGRQSSLSSFPNQNDRGGIMRISYDSGHHRQESNASEVSGSFDGAHGVSELDHVDANEAASRRRSSSATRSVPQVRRTSDPPGITRGRSDGTAGVTMPTLNEMVELHGYYGPMEIAAGQTAARLNRGPSSGSSAPGYDR